MSILRHRMTEDMQLRNLALNTQISYLQQISCFARHFAKSPAEVGEDAARQSRSESVPSRLSRYTKANEPAIGRLVRREMLGQQPPRTAAAQNIEDRIHDFAHRPTAMAAGLGGRRQKRCG